ncbi:MAG TPA: matrixin family metalloprotease [Nocardioides sp.]|uniref:matrixin family metalloprotease n=1 Tax=Nocardioides sp. TaxID=35761 RepID=UPI002E3455CE|nr:matrixin family metalloprotease [Nocardioides sp.]HEX5086937.1 matrixin family metalloprotease [Nocardioides sp.]
MAWSWRERREQRRWRREAMRRLEELDRADREQWLGAMPLGTPVDGPVRPRRRRTTGAFLPGLLISAVIAGLVMLRDPGMTGYRFRELIDHLSGKDGGSYAFVATSRSGDPIGWNHCKSIRYVVNPAGAPDDWPDIVGGGVQEVTDASGFEFQYDGTSVERSFKERTVDPRDPPPVLIAWSDAAEVPDLAGSTAGIGGGTPARVRNRVQYVSGVVVLDTDAFDRMERRGAERSEELILAHELGHVLGLDHVDDVDELMNAEFVGQNGFGPGDRRGFEKLHELPCR